MRLRRAARRMRCICLGLLAVVALLVLSWRGCRRQSHGVIALLCGSALALHLLRLLIFTDAALPVSWDGP